MSNKRASLKDRSPLDAFVDPRDTNEDDTQVNKQTSTQVKQQTSKLKRATFYLHPDHHITLDELKLNLNKQGVKTDKSELVRAAIDYLAQQNIDEVANILTNK